MDGFPGGEPDGSGVLGQETLNKLRSLRGEREGGNINVRGALSYGVTKGGDEAKGVVDERLENLIVISL